MTVIRGSKFPGKGERMQYYIRLWYKIPQESNLECDKEDVK